MQDREPRLVKVGDIIRSPEFATGGHRIANGAIVVGTPPPDVVIDAADPSRASALYEVVSAETKTAEIGAPILRGLETSRYAVEAVRLPDRTERIVFNQVASRLFGTWDYYCIIPLPEFVEAT